MGRRLDQRRGPLVLVVVPLRRVKGTVRDLAIIPRMFIFVFFYLSSLAPGGPPP